MIDQSTSITCRLAAQTDLAGVLALQQLSGGMVYSPTWFLHHLGQIFIAQDHQEKIVGSIVAWKSPARYSTAIVDQMLLADTNHNGALAEGLLQKVQHYLQQQCIRVLQISVDAASVMSAEFWRNQGFTPDNENEGGWKTILMPLRICLHGKKMRTNLNTQGGQISEDTIFEYMQQDDIVWGTYHGGEVERGVLVGKMTASRDINFFYMQLDANGEFHQGTSRSNTEYLNDGRLVLYEDWVWTGNKQGEGNAVIEEIKE